MNLKDTLPNTTTQKKTSKYLRVLGLMSAKVFESLHLQIPSTICPVHGLLYYTRG